MGFALIIHILSITLQTNISRRALAMTCTFHTITTSTVITADLLLCLRALTLTVETEVTLLTVRTACCTVKVCIALALSSSMQTAATSTVLMAALTLGAMETPVTF